MDSNSKNLEQQLTLYTGGKDVKPMDISSELPRQKNNSYKRRKRSDIKRVVVHTTDWETTPQKIAEYDIAPFTMYKGKKIWNHISKKGCPAITYHEMCTTDKLWKTLDYEEISWHVGNWNPSSIGLAMIYKCTIADSKDQLAPPDAMLKIVQIRCGDICLELGLTPENVVGHRELFGTGWSWQNGSKRLRKSCPGKRVDLDILRKNIALYMQIKLKLAGYYSGIIDGDFGPLSKAALELHTGSQ